jgi:thymidylate synthase
MYVFEGNSASEVWGQAVNELCEDDRSRSQASRAGLTRELLHAVFVIHSPRQRWVLTRRYPINPAFAIAEIVWILAGRNDSAFLNYWNSKLPNYAGTGDTYYGAYGFRLRKHFGLDQLESAYKALQSNPDSRQVVLQIWDPRADSPHEDGTPRAADIPCNLTSLLKIRDGRLEWTQIMRSNDLFRGSPYNFIQFTSLQEILAGWLGVGLGSYTHLSDSLHIYELDVNKAYPAQQFLTAENNDNLSLDKATSDTVLQKLNYSIELLTSEALSCKELHTVVARQNLPLAFHNLLLVNAAEAARRRGRLNEAHEFMIRNSNLALKQAWKRWLDYTNPVARSRAFQTGLAAS